jgi:hypothetical protein
VKKTHLRRFPRPSSVDVRQYASLLRTSDALHLALFDQPEEATLIVLAEGADEQPL